MQTTWEEAVAGLEQATRQLAATGAFDLAGFEEALRARSATITRLHEVAANQDSPPSPELLDRLKAVLEAGNGARQKLALVRAATRADLERMGVGNLLLRTLGSHLPGPQPRVDCRG